MSSLGNIGKIPELKKRILFTLFVLAVYRIGVHIPTPGINLIEFEKLLSQQSLFQYFNLFSGGGLEKFSIFALGTAPYITASIIMQLLAVVFPSLEKLQKEGEQGRKKINQYTRYGTILLAFIQGFGMIFGLAHSQQNILQPDVGGFFFYFSTILTLTTGTVFIMWLGEQISERGIGNGISLIIFAGIVARIPAGLRHAWDTRASFIIPDFFGFVILLAFIFLIVAVIIFFERAQKKVPIHYAKRVVGRKVYSAQNSHLPLKLNVAGVIPPIFASSLLAFPAQIGQLFTSPTMKSIADSLAQGMLHNTIYVLLIVFFCFFYTAVSFNPENLSENIKKNGGFIPGIRPGKATSDYIDRILTRITVGGALYIASVCILPQILMTHFKIPTDLAYTFGGTSLLIMIGVAMDTIAQMESYMLTQHYDGFLGQKAGKFRGRRDS